MWDQIQLLNFKYNNVVQKQVSVLNQIHLFNKQNVPISIYYTEYKKIFCKAHWYDILWKLVGWLCLTSHRLRGHLESAPPFTVPCEGREAQ